MKKGFFTGICILFILILFSISVSAAVAGGAKYHSPIVTGQNNDYIVDNNLLLGTQVGEDRPDFAFCTLSGSGDDDYRYLNVDDDGNIYLTDDDYINIFDENCNLYYSYPINGTLMSQPYVYDVEGDGFPNVFYISYISSATSLINTFEFSKTYGATFNYDSKIYSDSLRCAGLYCDENTDNCGTVCGGSSSCFGVVYDSVFDFNSGSFTSIDLTQPANCDFNFDEINNEFDYGYGDQDFQDRSAGLLTGMDLDNDGNIELSMYAADSDGELDLAIIDLTDKTEQLSKNALFTIGGSGSASVYSSAGFIQTAQYGSVLSSDGEIFNSFYSETGAITGHRTARIYNSVGTSIKTVVDNTVPARSYKISNFAVADIDYDFKNDFCIALNQTNLDNLTRILCYSGVNVNVILTNCTIDDWNTDNPITISLMNWGATNDYMNLFTPMNIYGLETVDGSACDKFSASAFAGLSSASEGALVPVDVSGDNLPDLIYYGAEGAVLYKTESITEPLYSNGTPIYDFCPVHSLFCDLFNYDYSLSYNEWEVKLINGQSNNSVAPLNNRINDTSNNFYDYYHVLNPVPVDYITSVTEITTMALLHPVVTHHFDLTITDNDGRFDYDVKDGFNKKSIALRFIGDNITYYDRDSGLYVLLGSASSFTPNLTHNVVITQYFGLDTLTYSNYHYNKFPFNVSVVQSYYNVFIDNSQIGGNILYANNESFFDITIDFTKYKDTVTSFGMDNLYIFRGTNINTDNSHNFYSDLYINYTTTAPSYNVSEDLASLISPALEDYGFKSSASKLLVAIIIIIISIVVSAIYMAKAGVTGIIVGIIVLILTILEMVFFVWIGFIPVWVIFMLFILMAGVFAFILMKAAGNGE